MSIDSALSSRHFNRYRLRPLVKHLTYSGDPGAEAASYQKANSWQRIKLSISTISKRTYRSRYLYVYAQPTPHNTQQYNISTYTVKTQCRHSVNCASWAWSKHAKTINTDHIILRPFFGVEIPSAQISLPFWISFAGSIGKLVRLGTLQTRGTDYENPRRRSRNSLLLPFCWSISLKMGYHPYQSWATYEAGPEIDGSGPEGSDWHPGPAGPNGHCLHSIVRPNRCIGFREVWHVSGHQWRNIGKEQASTKCMQVSRHMTIVQSQSNSIFCKVPLWSVDKCGAWVPRLWTQPRGNLDTWLCLLCSCFFYFQAAQSCRVQVEKQNETQSCD